MALLAPLGLLALLAVPLIVALHLVKQQRRRLRVPALKLWERIAPKPIRKSRTLPLSLLLLLHVLVALCLGIALTQPAFRGAANTAPTHTIFLLDTTTSMGAIDTTLPRLERARREIQRHIQQLRPGDSVALIGMNDHPQLLASGGPNEARQLLATLEALRPAGASGELDAAFQLANANVSATQRNHIVVYTDSAFDTTRPITAAAEVQWQSIGGPVDNQAIVAFAAREIPNGESALYARVFNAGTSPVNRIARLLIDGVEQSEVALVLPAGGSVEQTWRTPVGASRAELILTGGDALAVDDRAVTPLQTTRNIRVRLISASPTALERMLASLPHLTVTVAEQFDPDADSVDLTVFNGVLPSTLPEGSVLVVNPPPTDPRMPTMGSRTTARASSTALDPAFAAVDLSSIQWQNRTAAQGLPEGLQAAIRDANGAPLIATGTVAERPAVVWLFDVDASNLPAKLAFPLLTAASIDVLATGALPPMMAPGSPTPNRDLLAPNGERADRFLDQAGWYALPDNAAVGVAVNFGDLREVTLAPQPQPPVSIIAQESQITAAEGGHRALWPFLIIVALAIVMVEWWYINGQRPLPRWLGLSNRR